MKKTSNRTMRRKMGGVKRKTRKAGHSKGTTLDIMAQKQIPGFEKLLSKKGALTLVFVYADWCPHCHDYKPTWKKICKERGNNVNMVSVNEKVLSKTTLPSRTTINGYPTVIAVNGTTGETAQIPNYRDMSAMTTLANKGSSTVINGAPTASNMPTATKMSAQNMDEEIDNFINKNSIGEMQGLQSQGLQSQGLQSQGLQRTPTPYPATSNTVLPPSVDEDFVENMGYSPNDFSDIETSTINAQRGGNRILRRLRGGY